MSGAVQIAMRIIDKGNVLIVDGGYSGEYAPAFAIKLHPCSVLIKTNKSVYKPLPFIRYSPFGSSLIN